MNIKSKSTLEKLEKVLRFRNYSDRTIKTYCSYAKMFLSNFNKDIYHVSVKEAESFLLNFNYSSISQQNQIISSVKHLYKIVVGRKLNTLNIERPRKERKLPKITNAEQLASKINSIKNLKHKGILSLGLGCGLRISEVVNLRWNDINRKENILYVINGKGKKDRSVYISDGLINLLILYYRTYLPEEYVFNGQKSLQYSTTSIQKIFKKYISKSESFHFLRHCYGTYAIDEGVTLPVLQRSLGHNSPKTTEIYIHLSNKSLQKMKTAI